MNVANVCESLMASMIDADVSRRLACYPMLLGAIVVDCGGKLEISERAMREAFEAALNQTALPLACSLDRERNCLVMQFEKEGVLAGNS